MKIVLFTGGTGLLGRYFLANIPRDFFVYATYSKNKPDIVDGCNHKFVKLDVANKKNIKNIYEAIRPDIVVHAASIGNVDYCEKNKSEAKKINITGTKYMLQYAQEHNIKFIFTSSNAVYDGVHPLFSEKSPKHPIDYYGFTKVQSEKEIIKRSKNFVIVRLMTMYGWNNSNERMNPVTWLLERLSAKHTTQVVDDIYNNYLYAGDAVKAIWKIIRENKRQEIYNIASSECISRYKLAVQAAKVFNLDTSLLQPVSSDYFKSLAPRPKNTCFDINKMKKDLQIRPVTVLKGLRQMKNEKR